MGTVDNASRPAKLPADESIIEYARIFEYLLEGCQIIGPNYAYLYVNDAAAMHGQTTKEKLVGRTMMECYPGIERTAMFAHLKRCMEKKEVHYMENQFRFPDGAVGWFELRMEPLPVGLVILSIDITERKQAEERVERLEEVKSVFIRIVSDQLRAPLATMRDSLESLRGTPEDSFGMQERVRLMAAHSAAAEVTDRLGEMTQAVGADAEEKAIKKVSVLFDQVWTPVYADCKFRAEAQNLRLIYSESAMPYPRVKCDPERIKQVLSALVDNAVRYTRSGKISMVIDHHENFLKFQVSDTGIGITAAEQPQIFKRRFRGKRSASLNPQGTGLSLAVAKYFVEQHGGSIGFTSEDGQGSTFWFQIPVNAP